MHYFTKNNIHTLETLLTVKQEDTILEKKLWKKVNLYMKYLFFVPGISCICVCNSLAMKACHTGSDIDLFVITKKNRLWTARIFLTLFFAIVGQRKTQSQHVGKFCLSFFVSEEALNIEKIALKNDIYLAYWIETLVPLINKNNTFERFQEENIWYKEEFSLHTKPHPNPLLKEREQTIKEMQPLSP